MDWSKRAREVIGQVHTRLPEGATLKERKAALKEAYPFGERQYWPYKAWCKAQREYLAKCAAPTKDVEAERAAWREQMRAAGFTFAGDSE